MIDFSKAPEGATHYIPESDDTYLMWVRNVKEGGYELNCPEDEDYDGWGNCTTKQSYYHQFLGRMIEIPSVNPLTVTCDNEHQKMLCEQVIRMCRGEAGDMLNVNNEWVNKSSLHALDIRYEYRAKPKKELVVPWEFINVDVVSITVNCHKQVFYYFSDIKEDYQVNNLIKLDLTDIELPVTVKRPEVK